MQAEVDQYLATALWCATEECGTPMDQNRSVDDFAPEAVAQAGETVRDFWRAADQDCKLWEFTYGTGQVGHDLYLTQNGHGTGFWDRAMDGGTLCQVGKRLTDLSKPYGECNTYVGDDGKLYLD